MYNLCHLKNIIFSLQTQIHKIFFFASDNSHSFLGFCDSQATSFTKAFSSGDVQAPIALPRTCFFKDWAAIN